MIRDLSDSTRHVIDVASPATTIGTGVVAAITLNQVVLMLTAFSLLLNIGWMLLKYAYLRKHGGEAFWGANREG